jgi:GR25 family glycosyltransferase involved in LPS biosynthesis
MRTKGFMTNSTVDKSGSSRRRSLKPGDRPAAAAVGGAPGHEIAMTPSAADVRLRFHDGHDQTPRRDAGAFLAAVPGRQAEELAEAMGEQSAIILDAMDRWFTSLLGRLDEAPRWRGEASASEREPVASPTPAPPPSQAEAPRAAAGQPVVSFDASQSWSGWGHHGAARLLAKGEIEVEKGTGTPGAVTPTFAIPGGSVIRLTIAARLQKQNPPLSVVARSVDANGVFLAPLLALTEDSNQISFYAPKSLRQMKIYLLALKPSELSRFAIGSVLVESIDVDDWRAASAVGAPIIASLASIPERSDMLLDSVLSLLAQCDRVRVFLNNYPEIPPFLKRPRVEVRRSQSFDDRGDAGKFAWINSQDPRGYRIVADDDLIFPPDFAQSMVAALGRYKDQAIVGLHGVLLKQPVARYYDPSSRQVFHFESALPSDRPVHILGTNCICFHSDTVTMRWSDFMWPNMADIFLARYAQRARIPMISVARPAYWVRQNTAKQKIDTIYDHSLRGSGSRFDTSWMQDLTIKSCEPMTTHVHGRPKVAAIFIAEDAARMEASYKAWRATCSFDVEWTVAVVDVAGADASELRAWYDAWRPEFEAHFVGARERNAAERVNDALELCDRLEATSLALIHGPFGVSYAGWIANALTLLEPGCWLSLVVRPHPLPVAEPRSASDPFSLPPCLVLLDRQRYRTLARLDTAKPFETAWTNWLNSLGGPTAPEGAAINGAWRALQRAFFVEDSKRNRQEMLIELLSGEVVRVAEPARLPTPSLAISDFFEEVLVINLDRRRDRWREVGRRMAAVGIEPTRVAAIDGADPTVRAEYERYLAEPPVTAPEARSIRSSFQFFVDYDSQSARAAFEESEGKGKAIRSAGAWGYLKTWRGILEQALREGRRNILVCDDDVVFHKQTPALFAAACGGLPPDWLILQLGVLQHQWEAPWIRWRSKVLYSSSGAVVGSHAVGVSAEAMPYLLDQVDRMLLPFDIGALAATVHAFPERCFVVAPNVAIQSLYDSDIGTSAFQHQRQRQAVARTYRWNLEDYDFRSPPGGARHEI